MTDIINNAFLAKLSIFQLNPKRKDRQTTNEVIVNNQATSEAGIWLKNIVNPKSLRKINAVATAARTCHYRLSLPWQDEGWRIISSKIYMEYMKQMLAHKSKFETEVQEFLDKYEEVIENTKVSLGKLFKEDNKPTLEEIKQKFKFSVEFNPIPVGSDFRVSLNEDALNSIKQNMENRLSESLNEAKTDMWNRIFEPINKLLERLKDPDAVLRNSLVSNIIEVVNILPKINITDDENLNKVSLQIKEEIEKIDLESIRDKNQLARNSTIKKVDDLLSKIKNIHNG